MATRRTSKLPTQADLDREKKKAQTRRTSKLPTQSDMDRARKDAKRKETSTSLPKKSLKEKVKQQGFGATLNLTFYRPQNAKRCKIRLPKRRKQSTTEKADLRTIKSVNSILAWARDLSIPRFPVQHTASQRGKNLAIRWKKAAKSSSRLQRTLKSLGK